MTPGKEFRGRLRTPQQRRSSETLERILGAARELMNLGTFDAATVGEICRRAGCSVGAFYGRFADKGALFHVAQQRLLVEYRRRLDGLTEETRWIGASLEDRMHGIVAESLHTTREWRGVLAAISIHVRSRRDPETLERMRRLDEQVLDRLGDVLLARSDEMTHPDPERAVRLSLAMITGFLRDHVIFPDAQASVGSMADVELIDELTRAGLRYLRG